MCANLFDAMLFSIGYAALTPAQLVATMDTLSIRQIVDTRSVPRSRRPGFNQSQLKALLGDQYVYAGDKLGGRGTGPSAAGLDWIADFSKYHPGESLCLLCLEEAPGDCHRYHRIAVPLLDKTVDVVHIYQDQLVLTSDLKAAIDANTPEDYRFQLWEH